MSETAMKIPQAMRPRGLSGRIFASLMERMNRSAYERAASLLALGPDARFLELGFGTGRLLEMVAAAGRERTLAGIDPSSLMVATAGRSLRALGVTHELSEGSADNLPWPIAAFDAAAALHCFQFWPDPLQVFAELRRVLRDEGRLVLILRDHSDARDREWLPNPWSRGANEPGEAMRLLERAGFAAMRDMPDAGSSAVILAVKKG
jgi:ubiquinone/menaquinone biosynthesis C-methylase UbiE